LPRPRLAEAPPDCRQAARLAFADYRDRFSWVRPRGGSIGFPRLLGDEAIDAFAARLVEQEGVLLLPGSQFGYPGNHFRIWSAASEAEHVARAVREQMSPTVFPVTFDKLQATVEFRALAAGHSDADYSLDVYSVRHPGGALAYRMRTGNSRQAGLVYISDNELGDAAAYDSPADWRSRLVAFARGAAILVHDAMYTREEYEQHRGWGHSHYHDVVQLALDAGVGRLVLYHHNPERSDAEIDERVAECRALVAQRHAALEVLAAAEGLTLTT